MKPLIDKAQLLAGLEAFIHDADVRSNFESHSILRASYKLFRNEMMRHMMPVDSIKHKPSSELKPSCQIKPITKVEERGSTVDELVEWCNNLAIGISRAYNPGPSKKGLPHYKCTTTNFGRINSALAKSTSP